MTSNTHPSTPNRPGRAAAKPAPRESAAQAKNATQAINATQAKNAAQANNPTKANNAAKANNPTKANNAGARKPGARRRARIRAGAAGYGRLASSRDREQARDRNAAERARVEEMLASAPLPSDRRRARWNPPVDRGSQSAEPRAKAPGRKTATRLRAVPVMPSGCPVCASTKVTTDDVARPGGSLRLSECLHCEHRWTERPARRFAELGGAMGRRSAPTLVTAP